MLQDIDPQLLQQGAEALMKIQITYCDDTQTILGITMAHVLAGQAKRIKSSGRLWTCVYCKDM